MVRFLERNGYDVSYIAGPDTHRRGDLLLNHKTFLSVGHDEYWSGPQRANVVAARDAGVNLMFLSGNEMYWRVRWENSYRTLTGYKETWSRRQDRPRAGVDRAPSATRATRRSAAGAGLPENAVTGTLYMANSRRPPDHRQRRGGAACGCGATRSWPGCRRGSRVRSQRTRSATSPTRTWTTASGHPGLVRLSTTTAVHAEYLQDFGNTVDARHRPTTT